VIRDGAARGFTEYTPAPGKPGFYTIPVTNEDGSEGLSELMPRDMIEGFLGINAVRDDFNVDPVKAANTEGTPVMLDLGANDLANKDKEKVDADNDSETTTTTTTTTTDTEENVIAQNIDEIEEGIDRDNITEEQVKSARKLISVSFGNWEKSYNKFPNTIKDADGLNKGLADIDEQLEVLLTADTKEKLEKGKKKTWYGGITRSYMYDRLSKARDKYKKAIDKMTPKPENIQEENVEEVTKVEKIPSKTVEKVETNLNPSIDTIDAGEVELKDTNLDVVVGSKAPREKIAIDEIDYNEETSKDVQSTKVYNLKPITQDQFVSTEGVKSKIDEIAAKHGFSADELIKLIKFETGGSFDPSQKSGASSAVGLIQFMPKTIKGLNKELDSEKVAAMTILEQLELVDAYFASQPNSVKGSHPYLQVATPRAATIGPDEILYKKDSKQAKANKSWQNEDGDVTPNSILTGAGFDPMPSTQA